MFKDVCKTCVLAIITATGGIFASRVAHALRGQFTRVEVYDAITRLVDEGTIRSTTYDNRYAATEEERVHNLRRH